MITQTIALFVDAYRELNAKKLFWITLALSGLVVLIYAAIGIDEEGISFLWFDLGFIPVTSEELPPGLLYKMLFMEFGLGLWLTWIATILALISTAGIIPDLITGGSIEMLLSKPISRTRLFLTKYLSGLLFVTLQITVFSAACFLVIGIRGGAWEPRLFLAVPLVVCFFSYLFCVCALLGLLTRSTIAALLLTLLFWFVLFLANTTDVVLLQFQSQAATERDALVRRVETVRAATSKLIATRRAQAGEPVPEGFVATDEEIAEANPWFGGMLGRLDDAEESLRKLSPWVKGVYAGKTLLPKTGETIMVLERSLLPEDDLARIASLGAEEPPAPPTEDSDVDVSDTDVSLRLQKEIRERPVWWVIGTSLAFEAVVLGICTIIFARRDY